MPKTMLLAGKETPFPRDFADAACRASRTVLVTAPHEGHAGKKTISDSVFSYEWNKLSPVAAHSLVLQCENDCTGIDEAVLYFDEQAFAQTYPEFNEQTCSTVLNEMVAGYQYLTIELLKRFELRRKDISGMVKPRALVFIRKSDVKNSSFVRMNPAVRAAGASFSAFAESIAALFGSSSAINTILVHADMSNDSARSDVGLASWLCGYLDAVAALKTKLSARQSLSWVKPGAKGPSNWFSR